MDFEQKVRKSDRLAAITHRVGYALLQVQVLEETAARYLVLRASATEGMGVKAARVLMGKAKTKTFGGTITGMIKANLLEGTLKRRFEHLLQERNWLVHRSRRDSTESMEDDALTAAFVARVDAIAEESLYLLREILGLTEEFVRAAGFDPAVVAANTEQLIKYWEDNDAI